MGLRTTPERLSTLIRVDADDPIAGCWRWLGTILTKGYGQVGYHGRGHPAHRFIYEMTVGAVPEGLDLDHLCRNRWCVNPRHLEPVTPRENVMRGIVPSANREFCKAGIHRLAVVGISTSDGCERCAACRRASKRRHRARQLALPHS